MIGKPIYYLLFLFSFCFQIGFAQDASTPDRLLSIKTQLDTISKTTVGLNEKVNFNVDNLKLTDFVRSMANIHNVNISLENNLHSVQVSNNFSDAIVKDVLVYLCKNYNLTIDFTGNILSLKKFIAPKKPYQPKVISIEYSKEKDLISLDLKQDTLSTVFKKLTDLTGRNIVYTPSLSSYKLTGYLKNLSFETALEKIAFSNNLIVNPTRDGIYILEPGENFTSNEKQRPVRSRAPNFYYKVLDTVNKIVEVDFENTKIDDIIHSIGMDLDIDMFTTAPLQEAGKASVKAKSIHFDFLLEKILINTPFTFKKVDYFYFLGKEDQLSSKSNVLIPLQHRSITVMEGQQSSRNGFGGGGYGSNYGGFGGGYNNYSNNNLGTNNSNFNNNQNFNNGLNNNSSIRNNQRQNSRNNSRLNSRSGVQVSSSLNGSGKSILDIIPEDIKKDLVVSVDLELNSFLVSGDSQKIEQFREFVRQIDKPVPVILIEVMFIEYTKNSSVETGINWGIGEEPTTTKGNIFPSANIDLGATTINKIIGGFKGFGSANLGKVVPNFYANIKALENNGDIDIKSTPKIATLNGHQTNFTIDETTYFAVVTTDIIGSQNPQSRQNVNYQPINAGMSLGITPMISSDENITMSINVVQSSFNGQRIAPDAPPGMNSREFTSILRVKDQDVIILGGLEEKIKNDSGSGVPFLARIPIIKWFFSSKKREDTKKKLSILIKPTVIK